MKVSGCLSVRTEGFRLSLNRYASLRSWEGLYYFGGRVPSPSQEKSQVEKDCPPTIQKILESKI